MLSTHEKNQFRVTIRGFNFSKKEKDEPVQIKSIESLKQEAFSKIREQGFSLIQQVPEDTADCIVRIYYNETLNISGYMCFTKKTKGFKTITLYGKKEPYCKSKCTIRLWKTDDEYIDLDCQYKDFFVKVSSCNLDF